MSGRGQFGRYLIREYAKRRSLKATDAQEIIKDLFTVLSEAGLLIEAVKADGDDAPATGCGPRSSTGMPGNGLSGAEDRVRRTLDNEDGPRVNPFFRDLYKGVATTLPACGPRSTPRRSRRRPAGAGARVQRGRRCRCCTARRRWNSASTSTP